MATQLLIYETAVPVTQTRHGQWSVDTAGGFAFCRKVNSVPLMTVEFPRTAAEYPIVFAGNGEHVMPAVILGLRAGENLFLTEQGGWDGKYIPAFVRRYPFVFSSSSDGTTFSLCIDEAYAGCNQEGRGQQLFDDNGKPTNYVQDVLRFLQGYQAEFQRTQTFCKKLKELNLLEPMQAQITLDSGQIVSLTGFLGVNKDRLKALSGDTLADLAQADELEWVFLHLLSLQHFESLKERLAGTATGEALSVKKKGNGASGA
ncbi:SapC family protein [Methylococcus sp. EFPC2]|uniref:SapC family protein n=1 Tax=Methylococcus sp. EFPC2 TaxID=2812648 RepID=UPI0019680DF7|nr:SapC family protein [Methylococcus sp. EFPC2]QSA98186.1 SapC family protein [Methylococcus sp. EFPC2]